MILDFVLTTIVTIALFILAGVVYFHNKKSASNKFFALFCIATSFHGIANYFALHSPLNVSLYWIRMVIFFAVSHQFFLLLFVHTFPNTRIRMGLKKFYGLVVLAALAMLAAVSPYVFTSTRVEIDKPAIPEPGILMPFFTLTAFVFFFLSIYFTFKGLRRAQDIEKVQWKFILSGFIVTYTLLFFLKYLMVVFFGETGFVRFDPIFVLPFVISSSYAILRYRFMDIRVIITKGLVYSLLLIIIFTISAFFILVFGGLFQNLLGINFILASALLAFLIALIFQPLRKFVQGILIRILFKPRRRYELPKIFPTQTFRKELALEVRGFTQKVKDYMEKAYKIDGVDIYFFERGKKLWQSAFDEEKTLSLESSLLICLEKYKKLLVRDEIPFVVEEVAEEDVPRLKKAEEEMKKMKMAVAIPLIYGGRFLGILFIGDKISRDVYTVQDLKAINSDAEQFAFYLHNIIIYHEAITRAGAKASDFRPHLKSIKGETKKLDNE